LLDFRAVDVPPLDERKCISQGLISQVVHGVADDAEIDSSSLVGLEQLFDGQWTIASATAPAGKIRGINMGVPINNHVRFSFVYRLSNFDSSFVYPTRFCDGHGFHPLAWSSSLTFRAKVKSKIVSSRGGSLRPTRPRICASDFFLSSSLMVPSGVNPGRITSYILATSSSLSLRNRVRT